AQEGRHAQAHEQLFDAMRAHGLDIDGFLKLYRRLAYGVIEKLASPELRLSATAALEHYTATLAEGALRDRVLDGAHPAMRALLLWHSAEEIEHKAVAFDVLQRINPSYPLRLAGLVMATATLGGFWMAATAMLLAQDDALRPETWRELREVERTTGRARRSLPRDVFWAGIKAYARRDFHPSQIDNDGLARDFLAEAGLA
ncbi:MAG: metal-dependent hydrolase, partial [Myxococcales bacterium]